MSNALPDGWMDRIWQRLTVRYGQQFLGKWAGIDLADVKADWAEQLGGFAGRADCIKYALDNLPRDKAPTVGEFRTLCNAMPDPQTLMIEHKRGPIPESVAQELARLKRQDDATALEGPKGWAHRLKARDGAGERLGVCQRKFWREALGEK